MPLLQASEEGDRRRPPAHGRAAEGATQVFAARGCHRCFNTGYAGRRALYELLNTTQSFRDLIIRSAPITELREAITAGGFRSLEQGAFELLAEGVVSYEEIERVVGF